MKTIDDAEIDFIKGSDVLVVNALRVEEPHHSHQLLDDAVRFSRRVEARRTLFIHSSHHIGLHADVCRQLPEGMEMAYDGQVVDLEI